MDKIKHFLESEKGKDVLTVVIIILVGLVSFGLGRLSKSPKNDGFRVEYGENGVNIVEATNQAPESQKAVLGTFFASKQGTRYYPVSCPAGNTIKEENKIYFDTREEAEASGYELSGSCR